MRLDALVSPHQPAARPDHGRAHLRSGRAVLPPDPGRRSQGQPVPAPRGPAGPAPGLDRRRLAGRARHRLHQSRPDPTMSSVGARSHSRRVEPGRDTRRTPDRRWLVLAAVVLALLAAFVLGRTTAPNSSPAPPAAARQPSTPAASADATSGSKVVGGVPVGYTHDQAGAEAAAANYVVAMGSAPMAQTSTRHAIVGALADPQIAPSLVDQLDQAYAATLDRFGLDSQGRAPKGQTFVSRTLPVGVRADAVSQDTARVEVWSAGLIGFAGKSSAQPVASTWTTTTVSLRWADGDWKWVDRNPVRRADPGQRTSTGVVCRRDRQRCQWIRGAPLCQFRLLTRAR